MWETDMSSPPSAVSYLRLSATIGPQRPPRALEGGCPRLPQGPRWASFALKEMGSFMSTILQTGMQSREAFPLIKIKTIHTI